MSSTTTTAGGRAQARLTAALTRMSDRVHAPADERAHAAGWIVAVVPGPLGLNGRAYRHPRFGSRPCQPAGPALPVASPRPEPPGQPERAPRCTAS